MTRVESSTDFNKTKITVWIYSKERGFNKELIGVKAIPELKRALKDPDNNELEKDFITQLINEIKEMDKKSKKKSPKKTLKEIERIIHLGDWVEYINPYGGSMFQSELIEFMLLKGIISEEEADRLKSYIVGSFVL